MEIRVTYHNLTDRATKVTKHEAKGLRMLHDDFDPNWNSNEEPYGVLTFTDIPAPASEPVRDLAAEIDDLKAKMTELEGTITILKRG